MPIECMVHYCSLNSHTVMCTCDSGIAVENVNFYHATGDPWKWHIFTSNTATDTHRGIRIK